jgi:hypothetical protein
MALCPSCGAPLDADGVCASCMLAGGLDTEFRTMTTAGGATHKSATVQDLESDHFGPYRLVRLLEC